MCVCEREREMFRFGFCEGGVKEDDHERDKEEQQEEEEEERVRVREVHPASTVRAICDVYEDESAGEVRAITVHGGVSVSYCHGAGAGDGVSDLVRGEYEGGFKLWVRTR